MAEPAGLFVGTSLFAAGMSLLYPAMLLLALDRAPDTERASVVGTFSSFFDLSQGLGALILGGVAELSRLPRRVRGRRRARADRARRCCAAAIAGAGAATACATGAEALPA